MQSMKASNATAAAGGTARVAEVQPEDNWNLVGNPTIYMDVLPQPYRFIHKCMDQLIMKPVFNQITVIEQRKRTPEYEGNLKEVSATGFMDLNGVTAIGKMSQTILAGGVSEKAAQGSDFSGANIQSKLILGDKFGQIHLVDVSRKLALDKMEIPRFKGRRIIHISSSTIEWTETKLTFVAVVARGSPVVSIICFKHNDNKLHSFYSINTAPALENSDALEQNEGQTYLELPAETKLSLDCEFMSIITFDGAVKIIRMPEIIDPMQQEKAGEAPATAVGHATPDNLSANQGSTGDLQGVIISGDIEGIEHQDLDLAKFLIASIPPKQETTFEDPYKYVQEREEAAEGDAPATERNEQSKMEEVTTPFRYLLGKEHVKDSQGGDGGCLCKTARFHPTIEFVRSQYCGRQQNSIAHQDVASSGNSKLMKAFMVTTGLLVAYRNSFEVHIYNIQAPSKDTTPQDYSQEYYSKILVQRRLNGKKKNEKTLSSLIRAIQLNGGKAPEGEAAGPSAQEIQAQQQAKHTEALEKRVTEMRAALESQISRKKPARCFTMPYQVTCAQFQSFNDDYQALAVGLIDGAIVIIDLILGVEKHFLEKHPAAITTMSFFEDKALVSGSVDGRVNIADLENLDKKKAQTTTPPVRFSKCQNCQDRKIPVARVDTSPEFGIAMAVDIEGHCRFYDVLRFKKMAKMSSGSGRGMDDAREGPFKFRLMSNVCLEMAQDAFLGVTQTSTHYREEKSAEEAVPVPAEAPPAKGAKGAAPVEEVEEVEPVPDTWESEVLQDKMYADAPEKLKSLVDVVQAMPEGNFYTQKSNLSIFRYEDVIFAIFPHLAALKRRGASTKEIFSKNDPFAKKDGAEPFPGAPFAENSERGLGAESGTASRTLNASRAAGLQSHGNQTGYALADATNTSQRLGAGQSQMGHSNSTMNYAGLRSANNTAQPGELPVQKSYDIPTIKLLNPELYKEMEKKHRQMRDPAYQSLKNIKERHTYLENRQQRIDKRNAEIARELEEKNQEKIRLQKLQMLGQSR